MNSSIRLPEDGGLRDVEAEPHHLHNAFLPLSVIPRPLTPYPGMLQSLIIHGDPQLGASPINPRLQLTTSQYFLDLPAATASRSLSLTPRQL